MPSGSHCALVREVSPKLGWEGGRKKFSQPGKEEHVPGLPGKVAPKPSPQSHNRQGLCTAWALCFGRLCTLQKPQAPNQVPSGNHKYAGRQ